MRNLCEVIEKIIKEIPIEQEPVKANLRKVQQDLAYAAPETIRDWWFMTWEKLCSILPTEYEKCNYWQKEVADIWMDKK